MRFFILYGGFFFFLSCVEPYDFKVPDTNQRLVVVDGLLTDKPMTHLVRLSYTYPLDTFYFNPVGGANVSILRDDLQETDFMETKVGEYTSPSTFFGMPGRSYKLRIRLNDGAEYESEFVEMVASPPIDSIYGRYEELLLNDENRTIKGIQFYIDTHDESNDSRFFRFEWSETYKINVPLPSAYVYDFELDTVLLREEMVGECYRSFEPNELIIGTSIDDQLSRLSEQPIRLVDQNSQRLRTRYSIKVRQLAITKNAYNYYRQLKENNESGGSLFDQQQGTVYGNVKRIGNQSETVLGYFEVAGETELRSFFTPYQFDDPFNTPLFLVPCFSETISSSYDSLALNLTLDPTLQIHTINTMTGRYILADRLCTDCSWYATTVKPEFWED
jgi:hypothetical protein